MIVFTNGCFDLIHPGHIDLLNRARSLGSKLVVGINSDASIKRIKGSDRPILSQDQRKSILLGLKAVDEVYVFDELTPEALIKQLKPNVLVKGGDWPTDQIIGADFVISNGGEVHSLPLLEGYSSSNIVDKIRSQHLVDDENELIERENSSSIDEHLDVLQKVKAQLLPIIMEASELLSNTFKDGKKVLICGNGGSAADAQHIAAEFTGRFEKERRALPAIALTTDTSALTAIGNDYDIERIFARQVDALANDGDCLIAISTSGNSPNVISAVMEARKKGCSILSFTGANGKKLASLSDCSLMIPSERTARIQEMHILIAHMICEYIDSQFN